MSKLFRRFYHIFTKFLCCRGLADGWDKILGLYSSVREKGKEIIDQASLTHPFFIHSNFLLNAILMIFIRKTLRWCWNRNKVFSNVVWTLCHCKSLLWTRALKCLQIAKNLLNTFRISQGGEKEKDAAVARVNTYRVGWNKHLAKNDCP